MARIYIPPIQSLSRDFSPTDQTTVPLGSTALAMITSRKPLLIATMSFQDLAAHGLSSSRQEFPSLMRRSQEFSDAPKLRTQRSWLFGSMDLITVTSLTNAFGRDGGRRWNFPQYLRSSHQMSPVRSVVRVTIAQRPFGICGIKSTALTATTQILPCNCATGMRRQRRCRSVNLPRNYCVCFC